MTDGAEDSAAGAAYEHAFRPGFRISGVDGFVLLAGAVLVSIVWPRSIESAVLMGAVVLHFFLFCNVFRVARAGELLWSAWFLLCAWLAVSVGTSWFIAAPLLGVATCLVVWHEIRKPSYHGILWRRLNPGLHAWWVASGSRQLG